MTGRIILTLSAEFTKSFSGGTGYPGESEDCLYLNVYAPAKGKELKPVLFWLYGGDLKEGTAMQELYDGSSFAANQDVVFVSPNYRINGTSIPVGLSQSFAN